MNGYSPTSLSLSGVFSLITMVFGQTGANNTTAEREKETGRGMRFSQRQLLVA